MLVPATCFAISLPLASVTVGTSSIATMEETRFIETNALQYEFRLTTTARWQIDDGDRTKPGDAEYDPTGENFGDFVSTFGGSITFDEIVAALRLDSALYVHAPVAADTASPGIVRSLEDRYVDQIRLEYAAVSYAANDVELVIGDYYQTLGRGMVLAVRKVDDVGVDNKLRGGRVHAIYGGLGAEAFGGFLNIQNFEPGTGFAFPSDDTETTTFADFIREPDHFVAGGRIEYRAERGVAIGAHTAFTRAKTDLLERSSTAGHGVTLELPALVPWASLYVEGAILDRDAEGLGATSARIGKGLYANANLLLDAVTISIEAKRYDDLFAVLPGGATSSERQTVNRLMNAPTAEHPRTLLLDNENVGGGRVRMDYRVASWITPHIAGGLYRNFAKDEGPPTDIAAVYGGTDLRWESGTAKAELGYRGEWLDADERAHREVDAAYTFLRGRTEFDGEFRQKIAGPYSAGFLTFVLYTKEPDTSWFEGRTALSLDSRDGWSTTVAWEYFTQNPDRFAPHYFSLAGQWKFLDGGLVRALVGQERAGLKCAGGACRFFPGFEGARLEVDLRF